MTLNMADTVQILSVALPHVHNTVNWHRRRTFSTVESEIPASATSVALIDSEGACPFNFKPCISEVLGKHTFL